MKTRWFFLAALLSLGVATASVPCWLGRQMEHRFADGLERLMERTGIHLSRLTFERGWLHSVAITHWRAATAPSGADDDTLTLRHVIDHDWAVALRWVFRDASIAVRTTLARDAVHAGHRQSGGDPEPLAILSRFSANGDSTHAITLASLSSRNLPPSRPGALRSLTLSGLRGEIRLPARTEQGMRGSVRAEHLSLETAKQAMLTVRDVALEVTRAHDQVQSTDRLTTRLQLGSLAIVLPAARQRLQGQGIALNSLMTALPTHRLDIDVTVQAGQITAEEPAWSGAVQLTARRLDLQGLVALRTWLDQVRAHTAVGKPAVTAALQQLLRQRPEIKVAAQARNERGEAWRATALLNLQAPLQPLPTAATTVLLKTLADASVQLSASQRLLEAVLIRLVRQQLQGLQPAEAGPTSEPAAMEARAAVQVRQQLARLLDTGALRLDGGSYHANVQFTPDRLQINGIAVSP